MKWLAGILLLATTIAVVAVAFSSTATAVNPDEAVLKFFPQTTSEMIFVDVGELRDNELVRNYLLDRLEPQIQERAAEFARHTGLDPLNDVNQVVLSRAPDNQLLAVVRADNDRADLESYLRDRNTGFEVYEGQSVYRPDPEADWSMTFVDEFIFIGETASVRGAIDRMVPSAPSALDNLELLESVQSIEEGNQVWGVGQLGMLIPEALAPPMAIDLLAALERVTYQMRLDSALTAWVMGEFATPAAAQRTGDLLRGVVALGKMQVMESQELVQLLDGLEISSVESSIEIRFSADGELLRRFSESNLPFAAFQEDD